MIKILVFLLVIASTLKQTKCNTIRETISPEKITADTEKIKADIEKLKEYTEKIKADTENFKADVKESLKKAKEIENEQAKPVEESSSAENMTYVASNETENSKDVKDTKRVFIEEVGTKNAIPKTFLNLPFPLVTMDGESQNKTAELIRIVNEAELVSHDVKMSKPDKVKYSQGVLKDKSKTMLSAYPLAAMDDESHSRTAALIRTINEANLLSHNDKRSKTQVNLQMNRQHYSKEPRRLIIFDNFQPELDRPTPDVTNDMHKEERRYIISNFDVIESYIYNRRHSNLVPIRRMSKINEGSTASESRSDDKILRNNDDDIEELLNKVNYDEKNDDYVETKTSKRNVWDYEHEDWAVTKKVDWSDVYSSKEAVKEKPRESKIDNTERSSHQKQHKTNTKSQDTAVTEDCSNKDVLVNVKTILKDDDKPNTESKGNNYVKIKSNSHKVFDNDSNEKELKRHRSKQSAYIDSERPKNKQKSSKKTKGHHDRKISHKKSDDLKIDRKHRAGRSNKSPTLTDSGKMPRRSRTEKKTFKKKKSEFPDNSEKQDEKSKSKHTNYGGFNKDYEAPKSKAKKSEDALKYTTQAYQDSSEKNDKDLNTNRDQDDWNPLANNNWDKVGLDSDSKKDSTRRTTEYYNKYYNYKKQTDYNDNKQTSYKIDKAPSWDKHESNNNWDTVGIDKKSDSHREYRYQPPVIPYIAPSIERPRNKNRKVEKKSNAFGHVRTSLPFRERKSVFDDD